MEKATLVKAARGIGMWIPAILLVLIFVPQGWSKFDDGSGWANAFRLWHYPDWFRITIGVLELGAALLLLYGRTAAFGAIIIIVVMLGGMGTHLVKDNGRHMTSEIVPLTLATIVLVVRRRHVAEAIRRPTERPRTAAA
jgi:putative oxidoreductase